MTTLQLDPQAKCDACGCFGSYRFDTETLCADCYAGRGSCCSSEFSGGRPAVDEQSTERVRVSPPAGAERSGG